MNIKKSARKRRANKSRIIIRQSKRPRLLVYRSAKNIYAQIIMYGETGDQVLACASTLDRELSEKLTGNKIDQAKKVGELIAIRCKEKNISEVGLDRAGYKYHGRLKALAEAARSAGLVF